LIQIIEKSPKLRKLSFKSRFWQKSDKGIRITVSSKSLESLRLCHDSSSQISGSKGDSEKASSNLDEIKIIDCPMLTEVCLENFTVLRRLKILKGTPQVRNLFLRKLHPSFRGLWMEECQRLKSLELLLTCELGCKELVDLPHDEYKFHFGTQNKFTCPSHLSYFKLMMNFNRTLYPNKAGLKWKAGNTPIYFSNMFQGWMQSKLLVSRLFPFVPRLIREDLFRNPAIEKSEDHTATVFTSKRSHKHF